MILLFFFLKPPFCPRRQPILEIALYFLLDGVHLIPWLAIDRFILRVRLLNLLFCLQDSGPRVLQGRLDVVYLLAMYFVGFPLQKAEVQMRQQPCFWIHYASIVKLITNFYLIHGHVVIIDSSQMTAESQNTQAFTSPPVVTDTPEAVIQITSTEQQGSNTLIYLSILLILAVVYLLWSRRKSKSSKRQIALIGERGSGKTQLFIALCGGKPFETVPSIANNNCDKEFGSSKYSICDFMGDNLSKEEVLSELARFHILINVIDGTDSKKLGDAALFIYRVLISKQYQKDPCNYVIFLNKEDEKGFHGQEKLIKRLEDEIETIKISRRNQPEDNQGEEDYLKNERTRFDLTKQNIKIVTGAAKTNRKTLEEAIEELC